MTRKQIEFMACLFEYGNKKDAIQACGISKTTAYRWLKDQEFRNEFERRKLELLEDVSMYLRKSLSKCSETLMEIVGDPATSAQIKINAIALVFQNARIFIEQTDILERMQRIEESLERQCEE